jgi:hypothetical protein
LGTGITLLFASNRSGNCADITPILVDAGG